MIVISDTSCLFYLLRLGCVDILSDLFGEIVVPPAVASELVAGAGSYPDIHSMIHSDWFHIRTLKAPVAEGEFPSDIDVGKAEAIKLAQEMQADQLLMDDLAGRRLAASLNLPILGTLGLLARARRQQLIGPLRPLLRKLVDDLGFRASQTLINTLLKEVGE